MINLYLVRHGQTTWNRDHRMQGWSDGPLTAEGQEIARQLGRRLANIQFERIYCSPAGRAVHTAALIYHELLVADPNYPSYDLQFETDPRLREIRLGAWEGKEIGKLRQEDSAQVQLFWKKPGKFKLEGAESLAEVQKRAVGFLDDLIAAPPPQKGLDTRNILIVAHTVWIKCALAYLNQLPLNDIWDASYIHPGSLSLIRLEGGLETAQIAFEGDITHRRQEAQRPYR